MDNNILQKKKSFVVGRIDYHTLTCPSVQHSCSEKRLSFLFFFFYISYKVKEEKLKEN